MVHFLWLPSRAGGTVGHHAAGQAGRAPSARTPSDSSQQGELVGATFPLS